MNINISPASTTCVAAILHNGFTPHLGFFSKVYLECDVNSSQRFGNSLPKSPISLWEYDSSGMPTIIPKSIYSLSENHRPQSYPDLPSHIHLRLTPIITPSSNITNINITTPTPSPNLNNDREVKEKDKFATPMEEEIKSSCSRVPTPTQSVAWKHTSDTHTKTSTDHHQLNTVRTYEDLEQVRIDPLDQRALLNEPSSSQLVVINKLIELPNPTLKGPVPECVRNSQLIPKMISLHFIRLSTHATGFDVTRKGSTETSYCCVPPTDLHKLFTLDNDPGEVVDPSVRVAIFDNALWSGRNLREITIIEDTTVVAVP